MVIRRLYQKVVPYAVRDSIPPGLKKRFQQRLSLVQRTIFRPQLIKHAERATLDKRWVDAVVLWRRALDSSVGSSETAAIRLSQAHVQIGNVEESLDVLEKAVAQHPSSVAVARGYARVAGQLDEWDVATTQWRRVMELRGAPHSTKTVLALALAQRESGMPATADVTLDVALAEDPDEEPLWFAWAENASRTGQWLEATRRWTEVMDRFGSRASVTGWIELSVAQQQMGDLKAAADVVGQALALHPGHRALDRRRAQLAMGMRDWQGAIDLWQELIARPGQSPVRSHRDLARSLLAIEDFARADSVLQAGLDEHPDDPVLLIEQLYQAIHLLEWSEAEFRWLQLPRPIEPGVYVATAKKSAAGFNLVLPELIIDEGRRLFPRDEAIARQYIRNAVNRERKARLPEDWEWSEVQRCCDRVTGHGTPYLAKAEVYAYCAYEALEAGATEVAFDVLEQGLQRWPDSSSLQNELVIVSLASGKWSRAAELMQGPVDETDVDQLRKGIWLARAHHAGGHHLKADQFLARTTFADDPKVVLERARLARLSGDHVRAIQLLEPVVDDLPDEMRTHGYRQFAIASRLAGRLDEARDIVKLSHDRCPFPVEDNPGVVAIIGGGPSLKETDLAPLEGVAYTIAVNATASALPWVDVAVTHDPSHLAERFFDFPGPVVAGASSEFIAKRGDLPRITFTRRIITDRLSEVDGLIHSGGHTSAHTALNHAFLMDPTHIALFGIDLTDFWGPADYWHNQMDELNRKRYDQVQSRGNYDDYHEFRTNKLANSAVVFASTVEQIDRHGIVVRNGSPVSSIDCFAKSEPGAAIEWCVRDRLR